MACLWAAVCAVTLGTAVKSSAQATNTNYVAFIQADYFIDESASYATILLQRTPADANSLFDQIEVEYETVDGTAISGIDYAGQRGTVTFFPGVQYASFIVPIYNNAIVDGNRTVNLILSNPRSGNGVVFLAGITSAVLTIVDDDGFLSATAAGQVDIAPGNASAYFIPGAGYAITPEEWMDRDPAKSNFDPGPQGAQITIIRRGGARGRIMVDWATTTNVAPTFGQVARTAFDFIATNGTVTLDNWQMSTSVVIRIPAVVHFPLLTTNFVTNIFVFPKTFGVRISNVRAAPEETSYNVTPILGVAQRTIDICPNDIGFSFNRLHYQVSEGQGTARIYVKRSFPIDTQVSVRYIVNPDFIEISPGFGGDHLWNEFPLEAGSDYAAPFADYDPPSSQAWRDTLNRQEQARIEWPDFVLGDRFIDIPIKQDSEVEFNEDMFVLLYKLNGETDGFVSSWANICILKILFDDQPAGAADRAFNRDNEATTFPPYNPTPGANNMVQALLTQPDGKVVIGGDFIAYNTDPLNRIARFLLDGTRDPSFNPGLGADSYVDAVAQQNDGKLVVAGGFTSFDGTLRRSIARLMTNGQLDVVFNPGLGADGPIRAVALQPDGKVLIGGEFTSINGTNRNFLARLNADGSLDTSFAPAAGPNGPVYAIALSTRPLEIRREDAGLPTPDIVVIDTGSPSGDLRIDYDMLGGAGDELRVYHEGVLIFNTGPVQGPGSLALPYGSATSVSTDLRIVVNENGRPAQGADAWFYVATITPTTDGKPIIGGNFTAYNDVERNFVARLNLDGSLDTTFDPGTGADGIVHGLAKQGSEVVMVGEFTSVDLRVRRGIARLNAGGSLDVDYDTGVGADNTVFTVRFDISGKALVGGLFTSINQTRRMGFARINLDGSVDTSFMDTAYNQFAGMVPIYSAENPEGQENFLRAIDTYRFTNITIITNQVVTNSVTNDVISTNVVQRDHIFVGGQFKRFGGGNRRNDMRVRHNVARIIGGETPGPGNIEFSQRVYTTDEDAGRTFITVVRTNGALALVSADFQASEPPSGPGAATAVADFQPTKTGKTNAPVWTRTHKDDRQFSAANMGPNNQSYRTHRARNDFTVYTFPSKPPIRFTNPGEDNLFLTIVDDNLNEGDEIVNLNLFDPSGERLLLGGEPIPVGTALGGRNSAQLIIVDNEFNYGTLGFSETNYVVTEEGRFARITVTREGGSSGTVKVDYSTRNGTAVAGISGDYTSTAGTLTFSSGQTTNFFFVPIRDDLAAEFEETVFLSLTNVTGFPPNVPQNQRLDPLRSAAMLSIIDNDFAPGRLSFTDAAFTVIEGQKVAVITVKRSGGNRGELFVDYETADGTARAGVDYVETRGTLHWVDLDSDPKTFLIPVTDDQIVGANKTVQLRLANPSVPEALGIQPTATLTIQNDDAYGSFLFSQAVYTVDENGDVVNITVLRVNGVAGTNQVFLAATNLTAIDAKDFRAYSTNLTFLPNEISKSVRIEIIDDTVVEGDKLILLTLTNAVPGILGDPNVATINIVDNELQNIPAGSLDSTFGAEGTDGIIYSVALQDDGFLILGGDFHFINNVVRNRLARLTDNGSLDRSFDPILGPNGPIREIRIQSDRRIAVGGSFTSINNTNRNYISRLNIDAAVDPTFNPGAGTDNPVYSIIQQPDGKLVIGGEFSTYNGTTRNGLVRVNTNGIVDVTFDTGTGANGTIYTVTQQRDGKILVGGDFTSFNGATNLQRIARLNLDGTVDPTFFAFTGENGAPTGANRSVRVIRVQSDGGILVGGLFTTIHGVAQNRIARLGPETGALDVTFNANPANRPNWGANEPVNTIALQVDGKILVGGDFTTFDGVTRNRITRLRTDGSVDPTINFGSGANATVASIVVQPDRKIVLAGGFTEYNGQPRKRIARIHGGSIAGSGSLEFTSPVFTISETGTNAVVTIRRIGGTTGQVAVDFKTTSSTAIAGVDFVMISTNVVFEQGETLRSVIIPVIDTTKIEEDKIVLLNLSNASGQSRLGPQPNAVLKITSDDSVIGFNSDAYTVTEDFVTGSASITVVRAGSVETLVSVDFRIDDGTATGGIDYTPRTETLVFGAGERSKTFSVSILDDLFVEGNETAFLRLRNPVGKVILSTNLSDALLTIVDNDFAPGDLSFTQSSYSVPENGRAAVISVVRTNGSTGVISVRYQTSAGTATEGVSPGDYLETTGILSFADGELVKSFSVPINDDLAVEGNESVFVTLSAVTGGATIIGPTMVELTIVDNDLGPGSIDETFDPGFGASATVRALLLEQDGQMLIGGDFTSYDGTNRIRIARVNLDGSLDLGFNLAGTGLNSSVLSIAGGNDAPVVISGAFNTVDAMIRNRVARLLPNGQLDPTFSLPLGLNGPVNVAALQSDGKVVIGGVFDMASAAGRNRIARLDTAGRLDVAFDPGTGADGAVTDVVIQPDGKILVAGAFRGINGVVRSGIARLHTNGALDTTFDPGAGVQGTVHAILRLNDGSIIIAGEFSSVDGNPRTRLAKLTATGSVVAEFNPGIGPNNTVFDLAMQPDGKILIAGEFSMVGGVDRNRIARLQDNGALDDSFKPGAGANDTVYRIAVQADGKIVIAGAFTTVDRRSFNRLARFNGDARFLPQEMSIDNVQIAAGRLQFAFTSEAGRDYVVEFSSDLESWAALPPIQADSSLTVVQDTTPSAQMRFFRVRRVGP